MFYDAAKRDHGLPQDPLKALIVPRPIGWISTMDAQGRVNLAPYSFYNGVGEHPPMVYFSTTGTYGDTPTKHSRMNACLLYTSPSPRDRQKSRMPSSA